MQPSPAPHPNPSRPRVRPPAKACDTQVHVFGPQALFPYMPNRKYDPPDAPVEKLTRLHDVLGFDRGVIVHPSIHGTDNRATLHAMRIANGRYRGVAVIGDATTENDLAEMDAAGIRGIRFNFVRFLGGPPDLGVFRRAVERVKGLGWHLIVHVEGVDLVEHEAMFRALGLPIIIDHMAHVDITQGLDQKPFRLMLELMKTGSWWVKIANGDRLSKKDAPWDDVIPYARAVIAANPDRVIWGTDWPHPQYRKAMPDDGALVDLLYDYVSDPALIRKILVDNPEALYGFER